MDDNVNKKNNEKNINLFCEQYKIKTLMSFLDDLPLELRDNKTEELITKTFLGDK